MRIMIKHPLSQLEIEAVPNTPTEMRIFWESIENLLLTDIATIKFQKNNAFDPSLNDSEGT
mgnify:CR=1 FL=1|tara:strand:+ start:491 stop:673 length:183 start_codon:yes stop_codon:yes gene_type:complete